MYLIDITNNPAIKHNNRHAGLDKPAPYLIRGIQFEFLDSVSRFACTE